MEDVRELARKYALQNAVLHGGKASPGAVIGKVIAEAPELAREARELGKVVSGIVDDVNRLDVDEQRAELEMIAPELLRREKVEKTPVLPELKNVKGGVVMRLAPYPSGPLHIGNARAAVLNDEYVKKYGGKFLLVFDDTIGSDEKRLEKDAYQHIRDGLDWLGVDVHGVHYKSDRMPIYYEWGEQAVRKAVAYVCECQAETLRDKRERREECEHRARSIEENLELWRDMLEGEFGEGEAVLRIRTSMDHPNPAFRDRVLFRISEKEHPRVGRRYSVWPMLEFSWAVDDYSLGVTHVLRGKDLVIEDEMERFIWKAFGIEPREFAHYGMLRLSEMKLSKSKMRKEIEDGSIEGIDDPRTWSLQSLKRRGFSPRAVRNFILSFGMSQTDIEVPAENLYSENRKLVDDGANRYFFVPEPVEIKLDQVPENEIRVPLHPDHRERGERTLRVTGQVFVPKADFDSFEGGEVRLKDFCNVMLGKSARVTSLENKEIPRIQWVSEHVPVDVVMPDGTMTSGYGEKSLKSLEVGDVVQFERFGFVRVDEKGERIRCYFGHK